LSLNDVSLAALLDRLENNELDEYSDVATLIGIEFDENTVWGQLTLLELKLLLHLALKQWDEAHELVGAFLQYNDNTAERKLFYQALDAVLAIHLDDELQINDYASNLRRMFGDDRMDAALGALDGSVRFYGLTPTSLKLDGLDRHQRLLDSYVKLHTARNDYRAVRMT
jgi:ribosomal protein S12 methylthiotransferase accessory factor